MGVTLGASAKIYHLTTGTRATWAATVTDGAHVGPAPSSLTERPNVMDVEIPLKKDKVDVTTRASAPWRAKKGALIDVEITLPTIYDTTDAFFTALMKAYLTGVTIALALLDGDKATVGTEGLWADFEVLEFSKGEKIDGVQSANWVVAPGYSAVAPEWIQVAAA